jgi:glycosyltransferase involved in cell wall biosynthesis
MVFTPTLAPGAGEGLPERTVAGYRASRSTPGRLLAMGLASIHPRPIRSQLQPERLEALHFPLTVMVPRVDGVPTVTTVHDVLHLVHPEFFSRPERLYRRLVYRRIASGNRLVIVPSEHSRAVLVERLGLEPGRVRVIHHGLDHGRFNPDGGGSREPFVLYPADGYPHKNHARLLEAFARVRRERPELRLVLTGRDLEPAWAGNGVEVRGRVGTPELVALLRTASALVFPSLHETFGLPPLEAMGCGCPVAVSDVGSLREVCGDAARYFDPASADEIAAALLDVLEHGRERAALGLARAAKFDWETCARQHEVVYRELEMSRP